LLGAVALGTAACTPYNLGEDQRRTDEPSAAPPTEAPRADPDVALAAAVLAAEQDLVARIDASVAAHPRLRRVLAATREVHAAHVDLLADAAPDAPVPSPAPAAPDSSSPSPADGQVLPVPDDPARALLALARHEDALSLTDKRSAFTAESGGFARVLAAMAAAAAQQAAVRRATEVPGRRR
jgi:hypothetical protein